MPNFIYPKLTDWTLYLSNTADVGANFIVCYLRPASTTPVNGSFAGSILTPFSTIWGDGGSSGGGGANGSWTEDNPWAFLAQQGAQLFLPEDTVLPRENGGSGILEYDYIIHDVYPAGFIPSHITSEKFPGIFMYDEIELTYRRKEVVSLPYPGAGMQQTPITIDGEDFVLSRPLDPSWMELDLGERLVAEDSDLYYVPPPDPIQYPLMGVVWIHPAFLFLYASQAPGTFWEHPLTSILWNQPDTPTDLYFEIDCTGYYTYQHADKRFWINGATPALRSATRAAMTTAYKVPFVPPFNDGDHGTFDRFYWYWAYGFFPLSNFRVWITFASGGGLTPDRYRIYYTGRPFSGGSDGTALRIRPVWTGGRTGGLAPALAIAAALSSNTIRLLDPSKG